MYIFYDMKLFSIFQEHMQGTIEDTNYFKWVVFGGSDYCCISGLWVEIR